MKHVLAAVSFAAVALLAAHLSVAGSAYASTRASSKVPVAAGFLGEEYTAAIEVCYNGLGSDLDFYTRDDPYPVSLRITNVYRRAGKSRVYRSARTYRGDLAGRGFVGHTDIYSIGSALRFPCETRIKLESPFLIPRKTAIQTGALYLTVRAPDKRPATATFRYTIRHTPGRRIEEGSDAFFNYCLSQHPESVWSSGGKLVCYTDDIESISLRRVRK
jgi:hypothetical protein